jgi:DNA-binding transcriptional LysR family regulator
MSMRVNQIPLLAVFAEVCRAGSVTGAARRLGLSKSVVSTHLQSLEAEVGARLLHRTTRRLSITDTGEAVRAIANQVLDAVDEVDAVAESQRSEPTGVLRVAAPQDIGDRFVAPLVAELCAAHPALRAELHIADDIVDVVAHRLDATVRAGVRQDSSLIAQHLADDAEVLLAAPALAQVWAAAREPRALLTAPWIMHARFAALRRQEFRRARGRSVTLAIEAPRATANTTHAMRALLVGGAGLGVLPTHMVLDDLRAGRLVRLLPDWTGRQVRIDLLLPFRRHVPRRVALFAEALRTGLARADIGA